MNNALYFQKTLSLFSWENRALFLQWWVIFMWVIQCFYSESMKQSIRTSIWGLYLVFVKNIVQAEHLFKDSMLNSMYTNTEKKLMIHQNLKVNSFSEYHSWALPLLKILARRETFDWALFWIVLLFSCAFWRFFLDNALFLNRFRWISSSVGRCL